MKIKSGFTALAILLATTATAQDSFNDPQGQNMQQQGYPQQQQQGYPQQQQQGYPQQQQQGYPQQQQQGYPPQDDPQLQGYPQQQQDSPQQQQQGYPQQGQMQAPRGQGNPAPSSGNGQGLGQQQSGQQGGMQPPNFAASSQMENQDFGIQPISSLHDGAPHGPTPTSIPGGKVISTQQLAMSMTRNSQAMAVFDILGGKETLPTATFATPAAAAGAFNDQVQQNFGQYLQKVTAGNKAKPVVMYCLNPHCWMSYNAALRAINMGYTNVLWYRGGIDAWKAAGLPTASPNGTSN